MRIVYINCLRIHLCKYYAGTSRPGAYGRLSEGSVKNRLAPQPFDICLRTHGIIRFIALFTRACFGFYFHTC